MQRADAVLEECFPCTESPSFSSEDKNCNDQCPIGRLFLLPADIIVGNQGKQKAGPQVVRVTQHMLQVRKHIQPCVARSGVKSG